MKESMKSLKIYQQNMKLLIFLKRTGIICPSPSLAHHNTTEDNTHHNTHYYTTQNNTNQYSTTQNTTHMANTHIIQNK